MFVNEHGWKTGYYIYQDKILHVVHVTRHTFTYILYNQQRTKIREQRTSRSSYVNAGLFQFITSYAEYKKPNKITLL